jgi:hypothetical protein
MEEYGTERRTQLEMFLIGLCVGATIMFGAFFVQSKTGFLAGDILQHRVDLVEKNLREIDERLRLE